MIDTRLTRVVVTSEVTASLARDVLNSCFATSNFRPLANDVASFSSLLDFTKDEVGALDPQHKDIERIVTIVEGCNACLLEVQVSIAKYNALPTQSQWTWERTEMGATELTELRSRLGTSIGLLNTLNTRLARLDSHALYNSSTK